MIEFGNLQADLPRYQNPGSLKIDNVKIGRASCRERV